MHSMDARAALGARAWRAAREVVRRVRRDVPAHLRHAALFGSRARDDARPDSDIDLLLVFDALQPDREPHATFAEAIAEAVARESGVPVTVWSVSGEDLRRGRRTPMLVDALDDALPIWPRHAQVPRIAFHPEDALFCARCLLDRVAEGGRAVAERRARGDTREAILRCRDDLVRLCTAMLLLRGETRPRRAAAVRRLTELDPRFARDPVLVWAERSFGAPVPAPPFAAVSHAIDVLAEAVRDGMRTVGAGLATV